MFEKLYKVKFDGKVDKIGRYSYISWSDAWAEFVKICPDAKYEIKKNDIGLPYFLDKAGAMVYTSITADGMTHEMWLPVLNGANKPMKSEPYSYTVKGYNGGKAQTREVEAINMFDINKTVMRCLVKNMAMFGLGLFIYKGEDAPELTDEEKLEEMYPEPKNCDINRKKGMWSEYLYILGKHGVDEKMFREFLISQKIIIGDILYLWLRDNQLLFKKIMEYKNEKGS